MLYRISFILLQLHLRQPSKQAINFWLKRYDIPKLEYALKHGNYRTRRWAAEAIAHTSNSSSIPVLLQAINDKVQNVSVAALNALETIGISQDVMRTITKKRFYWLQKRRERQAKQAASSTKSYTIYRWERASKASFDRVKEQLKRPMR